MKIILQDFKKIMKIFYTFFAIFSLFATKIVHTAYAADPERRPTSVVDFTPPASPEFYPNIANPSTVGSAGDTIGGIIAYGIGLTAILAVIAVTWSGIQMFLAVGDEGKFNKAREMLIYALVGVGLSGLAYLIVRVLSSIDL